MIYSKQKKIRKIAVFTGNRAEYGLQLPILHAIRNHPKLKLFLLVSGAHLEKNFGNTLKEIKNDGFHKLREIKIEMTHDTLFSTAQAIGSGVLAISKHLASLKPDILLVYADRFEGFAAVIAGSQMGIPTAHVEGGDLTQGGALDDTVRHAMTKLSHLHFTTNSEAAARIRAMGEEKWRIYNVGFPAIDLIKKNNFASKEDLKKQYQLDFSKPIILFTQHSVTTEYRDVLRQLKPSLQALEKLAKTGCQVVVTYPNNDAGGRTIINYYKKWKQIVPPNIKFIKSLGRFNYHGILYQCGFGGGCGVCVGNSSSGIKETPALGCPAVNIGTRQLGRLRGTNVVDAKYNEKSITYAIKKCLFNNEFRKKCKKCKNPYGKGYASKKIANILAKIKINQKLIRKMTTI